MNLMALWRFGASILRYAAAGDVHMDTAPFVFGQTTRTSVPSQFVVPCRTGSSRAR